MGASARCRAGGSHHLHGGRDEGGHLGHVPGHDQGGGGVCGHLAVGVHSALGHFQLHRLLTTGLADGRGDAFSQDAVKQAQWAAFLKKNRLQALNLVEVVTLLRDEFQKLQKQG